MRLLKSANASKAKRRQREPTDDDRAHAHERHARVNGRRRVVHRALAGHSVQRRHSNLPLPTLGKGYL